ncbi:MAG TPA: histidine phosphatase family protein [Solirubrobacteraceae bacterium]
MAKGRSELTVRRARAMPTILLIRHAQASFGAADYDVLSERGRGQVGALVEGLARRGIVAGRVVCGSLRRQHDTAAPCASALGLDVTIDDRFDEYDIRDILAHHSDARVGLEHKPGDQTVDSREFQRILDEALSAWVAAGLRSSCREPWPRFERRLAAAVDDLAGDLGKGETALVVSSGGAIAAITAARLGLRAGALIALNRVSINTGITKLVVGRGGVTLISSNEHAHLEEVGVSLVTYR